MSIWIKLRRVLFPRFLNHPSASLVLRHCCSFNLLRIFALMSCSSCLLIFPILDLVGFINLHLTLFGKSSLWSLIVIYAFFAAMGSTLSLMLSLWVISFASRFMECSVSLPVFSQLAVTLSRSSFLYEFLSISQILDVLSASTRMVVDLVIFWHLLLVDFERVFFCQ